MATPKLKPWRVCTRTIRRRGSLETRYLVADSHGDVVAELPEGTLSHDAQSANAALIVEAVNDYEWALGEIHKMTVEHDEVFDEAVEIRNERDRLRGIVRKLANEWEQMDERDTVCNTDRVKRMYALFREALGEDTP